VEAEKKRLWRFNPPIPLLCKFGLIIIYLMIVFLDLDLRKMFFFEDGLEKKSDKLTFLSI
jgi:hypothetical protein